MSSGFYFRCSRRQTFLLLKSLFFHYGIFLLRATELRRFNKLLFLVAALKCAEFHQREIADGTIFLKSHREYFFKLSAAMNSHMARRRSPATILLYFSRAAIIYNAAIKSQCCRPCAALFMNHVHKF